MAEKGKRLSWFVFIDALGWDIVNRQPFLDDLLPHRRPMDTVFGYSSTCVPTFLTGKLPREHGHFAFYYYSPETSPFGMCRVLRVLPPFIRERARVRNKLSHLFKKIYGFTGYFALYNVPLDVLPLLDYSEKRDLYQPGGINGGCPTILDHLRDNRIPFHFSDWHVSDRQNMDALEADLRTGDPRFAFLYLSGLDGIMHIHGTRSAQTTDVIRGYETRLRALHDIATAHYDEVRMFLFSDHGMADISATCDLIARIERLGLEFGKDYAAAYDSTMARFYFMNDEARRHITEALQEESQGRILPPEELAAWGCDFPGNKFGDLFFLLDAGVLMVPSYMGLRPIAGMHGYDPSDKDSTAILLSSAPLPDAPPRLDGMYALMKGEATA